jgi:hypothetical protein
MKNLLRRIFPSREVREYHKMHRRHRRELFKLAENTRDWDYGWLDEVVRVRIKHMHEYFSTGNNVHQTDDTRLQIVEQLKHVLDLYEELDHVWDDYSSKPIINNDGTVTTTEVSIKSHNEKSAREQELYEEIYSYIGKYIQWWWD